MTLPTYLNHIGGESRPAIGGGWLDSTDPSTGRVWARVPDSGPDDVAEAVDAARRAAPEWGAVPPARRAAVLRRWARAVVEHADDLARTESRDNGRVLRETRGADLPGGAMHIEYNAGLADTVTGDTLHMGGTASVSTRLEPYGVVGVILPWNAPLAMFFAKVSGALAAGNAVVVKPAEQACCSVLAGCALLEEAGLPPGAVNVVAGTGERAGEALVSHPGVAKVHFTGSTATGRRVTELSAAGITDLSLELGGKSACIVFDDADLDAAAAGAAGAIYTGGAGQSCVAASRFVVQDGVFEAFTERVREYARALRVGAPGAPDTGMGPIASEEQYRKVLSYLELGPKEGAELLFGGGSGPDALTEPDPALAGGYWVEPTLFRTGDNGLRICQEEIFGPVAVALPFTAEEEAYAIANGTGYGLAGGAWTRDLARARRAVDAIDAGTVWINTFRRIHWAVPFGGRKQSGNLPSNGPDALREWLTLKAAWIEPG
ncbi:aldehyde dehydrogenase family protein [Nocardiopsis chromatogenes]|uniref:aldehyde dehydrogenase family protein n=1 Tax=Nocardiopsis chromatogenes TaxID=280239 RepID=UPI000347B6D8|nr:aldehyde dehydrogenase family protein [Nocardiopsis chromatogenes]